MDPINRELALPFACDYYQRDRTFSGASRIVNYLAADLDSVAQAVCLALNCAQTSCIYDLEAWEVSPVIPSIAGEKHVRFLVGVRPHQEVREHARLGFCTPLPVAEECTSREMKRRDGELPYHDLHVSECRGQSTGGGKVRADLGNKDGTNDQRSIKPGRIERRDRSSRERSLRANQIDQDVRIDGGGHGSIHIAFFNLSAQNIHSLAAVPVGNFRILRHGLKLGEETPLSRLSGDEGPFGSQFHFDFRPRCQTERFANLDRHRDLAFGADRHRHSFTIEVKPMM